MRCKGGVRRGEGEGRSPVHINWPVPEDGIICTMKVACVIALVCVAAFGGETTHFGMWCILSSPLVLGHLKLKGH